jgi:outer membrane protein TolC
MITSNPRTGWLVAILIGWAPRIWAEPLTVDDCVKIALERSAAIAEAEAKVHEYDAILAEVESIYYPKLQGLGYVAPMFTVTGNIDGYQRKWKALKYWGPHLYLQALLAQPLYTFGRAEAGERAASERAAAERARAREAELVVALEVRRLYYMRLFALSMLPTLNTAAKAVKEAREKGQQMYDEGSGEVTQADLMKLAYAATEVAKFQLEASAGAELALSALKHTMGLPDSESLELADDKLAWIEDPQLDELDALLVEAAQKRPEWTQIEHGKNAATSLRESELLAMAPIAFVAGQFRAAWSPTRDDADNPYHYDPYNELFGGIAVGLQFDLDPALALAKAEQAEALLEQVEALEKFAATGIPLRVRKAHGEVTRHIEAARLSRDGVKAARKWMAFSAAAYMTGTGEAKELLEGLVAFVQAKQGYYESLQNYYIGSAELSFAIGRP